MDVVWVSTDSDGRVVGTFDSHHAADLEARFSGADPGETERYFVQTVESIKFAHKGRDEATELERTDVERTEVERRKRVSRGVALCMHMAVPRVPAGTDDYTRDRDDVVSAWEGYQRDMAAFRCDVDAVLRANNIQEHRDVMHALVEKATSSTTA